MAAYSSIVSEIYLLTTPRRRFPWLWLGRIIKGSNNWQKHETIDSTHCPEMHGSRDPRVDLVWPSETDLIMIDRQYSSVCKYTRLTRNKMLNIFRMVILGVWNENIHVCVFRDNTYENPLFFIVWFNYSTLSFVMWFLYHIFLRTAARYAAFLAFEKKRFHAIK